MRYPRWANRLYAWLFGYFWLPCPVCRENFGGHEAGVVYRIDSETGKAFCVCYKTECALTAIRHNVGIAIMLFYRK